MEGAPQEIIQNNLAKQYYLGNNFLLNPLRSFP